MSEKPQQRLSTWFAGEFHSPGFLRSLSGGLLIFILEVVFVISFAALIFSGDLAPLLPFGIGFVVLGDAVICLVVALSSSYPGSIAIEQDVPAALLAVSIASVLAVLPVGTSLEQKFATVVIMMAGTTLVGGIIFTLLGLFKLGGLARFLPYPVMGGFLAGTGWLLLVGGIGVMSTAPFGLELLAPGEMARWLPGVVLGLVMLIALNRFKNPLIFPIVFLAGCALFYLWAWFLKVPLSELSANGWLFSAAPSTGLWQFPFSVRLLSQVSWTSLPTEAWGAVTLVLVSVIALLLNANSIELVSRRDIDLNHELVSAGAANIAAAFAGGLLGYHAISLSTMNHTMTGGKRLTGVFVAGALFLTAILGTQVFVYIPKMVMGGLLAYLGFSLMVDWIVKAWYKFPRLDFFIIILIVLTIAFVGFMQGIAVGIAATILLFLVGYSRVSVVKYTVEGTAYRSRVSRSHYQQNLLNNLRRQMYIIELHGYVFFGTAHNLFEHFRGRVRASDKEPLRYVLIDCRQVTGMDSTGLLSFSKILQLAQEQRITLMISGQSAKIQRQFTSGGLVDDPKILRYFSDLDHSIEYCEDELLARTDFETFEIKDLLQYFSDFCPDQTGLAQMLPYLQKKVIPAGAVIIQEGAEAEDIYILESGQATAQIITPDREPIRLETMRSGRVFGEMGVYLNQPRSATVIADRECVVFVLSIADLERMEKEAPRAAAALHRIVIHLLGERVTQLTRALDAVHH